MSKDIVGIIAIIGGIVFLIRQFFVDLTKPAKPGDWPNKKEYKRGLIIGGFVLIILGITVLLIE
jgi:hypothetical protein